VYVHGGTSEGFVSVIAGGAPSTKKWYPDPIIQVCHFVVQVGFWENERDKDNQHGVELALLCFDC
jgi:hypothetical protein